MDQEERWLQQTPLDRERQHLENQGPSSTPHPLVGCLVVGLIATFALLIILLLVFL